MKPIRPDELSGLSTEEKRSLLRRLLAEKRAGGREYGLSYGQKALWLIHKLQPNSAAYNVALTARLRQPLELPAFERALARLVERHAALRTTFVATDEGPMQRISTSASGEFRRVCSRHTGGDLREEVLAEHRRPFDLERGVFRVTLFDAGEGFQVLLITVHHLVFDAGSAQVLFDDLRALYDQEIRGAQDALSPLPGQYADFVRRQYELTSDPHSEELASYWDSVLSTPLPQGPIEEWGGQPPAVRGETGSIPIALDQELVARLREVGRIHNATLYVVMLAAFQALLHRYTCRQDLLIGSPASGRHHASWQKVIGYFINLLPMRSRLVGNPPFRELLAQARQAGLGALAHQEYPFPLMIERLRARGNTEPFLSVMFNLVASPRGSDSAQLFREGVFEAAIPFGNTTLDRYPIPQQEGQFGLVMEAMESEGAVAAGLKYSARGPNRAVAAAMASDYVCLLQAVAADPTISIDRLPIRRVQKEEDSRDVIVL